MTTPLTQEQLLELLKSQTKPRKPKTSTGAQQKPQGPRPVQFGPLRWMEKTERCASRGCGSTTLLEVNHIRRCSTHALYELNKQLIIVANDVDLTQCTCNAGRHSSQNIHTHDCVLFPKEEIKNAIQRS